MSGDQAYKKLSIIGSALSYALALAYADYCFWLIGIFLIPLFYYALCKRGAFSWSDGFLWGLIFFGMHFYAVFVLVMEKGFGFYRWLLPFFVIVYSSIVSAGWFWCMGTITRRCTCVLVRAALLWATTVLYFFVIDRYLFLIFGRCEGYSLCFPLIPWMVLPQFGYYCTGISLYVLTAVFIACSLIGALLLKQRPYIFWALTFCYGSGCLLFMHEQQAKQEPPQWLNHVGFLRPPRKATPLDCAQAINEGILEMRSRYPSVTTVIMPESSFPFPLNKHLELQQLWYENSLYDDMELLIGAHYEHEGVHYNVLCQCAQGRIINCYVKNHAMLFGEETPFPYNAIPLLQGLFSSTQIVFVAQKTVIPCWSIEGEVIIPCICSDLFCNGTQYGNNVHRYQEGTIFFVVNDSWFSISYMKRLLLLFTQLKAMEMRKNILYVGHEYVVFIDTVGNISKGYKNKGVFYNF